MHETVLKIYQFYIAIHVHSLRFNILCKPFINKTSLKLIFELD